MKLIKLIFLSDLYGKEDFCKKSIEWTARETEIETAVKLVELQVELALW